MIIVKILFKMSKILSIFMNSLFISYDSFPCKSNKIIVYSLWKQLNISTGGAAFWWLRVNVLSSDPMNLLVNASVGMWFAEY